MRRTERTVVYSSLAILGALNAIFLLSHSGRAAFAEAAAYLQQLGPAESVTLLDKDKQLVLRNRAGRLAWAADDFSKAYSVAFVDVGRAMNPLLESSEFAEDRDRLQSELQAKEAEYRAMLEELGEQHQAMDQNSPEAREKLAEAQRKYQEYMEWGQSAVKQQNELAVKQFERAFREMATAVDVVADRMNIDIVLRFIPTEKEFTAQDAEQALNEIRLRTAVRYPKGLDITTEVMSELRLQDKR